MNTDKILAEAIAKDYLPKDNSKIVALKNLTKRQNFRQQFLLTHLVLSQHSLLAQE